MKGSMKSDTERQDLTQQGDHSTNIGPLRPPWPRYRIDDAVSFAVYHAYKAGGDAFRLLFENDTIKALALLRHIFRLVESDGWTIARLFWLTQHHLLTVRGSDGH